MRIFLFLIFPFLFYLSFDQTKVVNANFISSHDTLTSTDSILQFWLKPNGVDDDKPIARTFYFWTTKEELDSVVEEHSLLRSAILCDNQFAFFYNDYRFDLKNEKWNKNQIANYFREGRFDRMRGAWPCYWSQNISDTFYQPGTQLVRVDLEDSSLIAVFRPSNKIPWEIYDLNGKIISDSQIEFRKNQIAVIYYSDNNEIMNWKIRSKGRPSVKRKEKYSDRCFFLCNEKMIKSWHHDVPGMQNKILDDLKYLLLLDAYVASDFSKTLVPWKNGKNVSNCWKGETNNFSVAQYYFRTQQFANSDSPEFIPVAINEIIEALRYRFPKQINPIERFPSKGIK